MTPRRKLVRENGGVYAHPSLLSSGVVRLGGGLDANLVSVNTNATQLVLLATVTEEKGGDVFMAGTADATISGFGSLGDDVLYIGTGHTLS